MKVTISFGKIGYSNPKRKNNEVEVDIELRDSEDGEVFAASASVWNNLHTDIVAGGQMIDELYTDYFKGNPLFFKIYDIWSKYHLNNCHSGCEHQQELGFEEDVDAHIGDECPQCGHIFGHSWVFNKIPEDVLVDIKGIINNAQIGNDSSINNARSSYVSM